MKRRENIQVYELMNLINELMERKGVLASALMHQRDVLHSIIVATLNGSSASIQEAINEEYKKIKAEVNELKPIRTTFSSGMEDQMLKNEYDDWNEK